MKNSFYYAKTKEKTSKLLRLIPILLVSMLIFSSCSSQTGKITNTDEQLEYYKISVDKSNTDDLCVLDNNLKDKEIFFTAEFHGVEANQQLELKFFKYFKEKTNFKYYLCELSYADSIMLNRFLETGDTSILDRQFEDLKGTFAYTKDSYNRWIEIYEYNKKLKKKDKIKVVGIDVEHQYMYALSVANELLPDTEAPAEIKDMIQALKNSKGTLEEITNIHNDLIAKKEIYKDYLGDSYFDIELIIRNIKNLYYVNEDLNQFNIRRDAVMYENFCDVYSTLKPGKFYGQWGHNHTYQTKEGGTKWLAAYLNEELFKDKILTIAYTYDNCEYMAKTQDRKYTTEPMDTCTGLSYEEANKDTAILLNLKHPNLRNFSSTYYQYILLISNSGRTTPFNE